MRIETAIRSAFDLFTLSVDEINQHTETEPAGVIKRIAQNKDHVKDQYHQYESRFTIIMYDKNRLQFDTWHNRMMAVMPGIVDSAGVTNVQFLSRVDGFDPKILKHVMALDFLIKHTQ